MVRGPAGSLASRVSDLLDESGGLTSDNALCGHGTPSNEFPSPQTLANDSDYCDDMNDPDECHYYSGGFDVEGYTNAWIGSSRQNCHVVSDSEVMLLGRTLQTS